MNAWQQRLFDLVRSRVGLSDERLIVAPSVSLFVRERMRALGLPDEAAMVRHLAGVDLEWHAFLNALLNGQTCFFRDREQLDAAVAFLADRQRAVGRTLYAWSAGCSTGEEPYSLAILADQAGVDLEVFGTDLNLAALTRCRQARYGRWSLRHRKDDLAFAFEDDGGEARVIPRLVEKVRFSRHNLLRDPALRSPLEGGGWDLIFCRNVLIYYAPADAADVARRLARALDDGGALALGASEGVAALAAGIVPEVRHGRVFYRGGEAAPARASVEETNPFDSPTEELTLPPATWTQELALADLPLPAAPSLKGFLAIERRVTALAEAGRDDEAARLLEELLDGGDDDVLAMLALGHVHLRRHAFDDAIALYARVQEHDPLLSEGHLFEGVAQRKRGAFVEARRALQRVLFLDPESWPASYLLAGTLERLGKHDEAARERRRALRLLEEHGGRATSTSTSSLALGMSLLPDPAACLERLRATRA